MPRSPCAAGEAHWLKRLDVDLDSEFLAQFANERLFGRFARVELSAGELPKTAMLAAWRTTLNENAPARIDQGCSADEQHRAFTEHVRRPKNLLISPGYADRVDSGSDAIAMTCKQFGHLLAHDQRGATAIEYGLIVSLIVLAMFGALKGVANANTSMWNNVSQKVSGNDTTP